MKINTEITKTSLDRAINQSRENERIIERHKAQAREDSRWLAIGSGLPPSAREKGSLPDRRLLDSKR